MKKLNLLLLAFVFANLFAEAAECDVQGRPRKKNRDVSQHSPMVALPVPVTASGLSLQFLDENTVRAMSENYMTRAASNASFILRQINLDVEVLRQVLQNQLGVKLIPGIAKGSNTVTLIIQLWNGSSFQYVDVHDAFHKDLPGMFGNGPLAPADAVFEFPMPRSSANSALDSRMADAWVKNYPDIALGSPGQFLVRQISLDAGLLLSLASGYQRISLVPGIDGDNNLAVILQLRNGDQYDYLQLKEHMVPGLKGIRGVSYLCPPPDKCDLP